MTRRCWLIAVAFAATISNASGVEPRRSTPRAAKPVIVLVHGAFAESSSWNEVVSELEGRGYEVVSVANPLRGVTSDATYVSSLIKSIPHSVVLVGHSYGGAVITNVAEGNANVRALVYVAGLAPDEGESASDLTARFPGSTLGPTLAPPVVLVDGTQDLYIEKSRFHAQFAADVPLRSAVQMAATQRPIAQSAFSDRSGPPAWKRLPSWFIYGSKDKNIPPALQQFSAKRAGARKVVEVAGASHVVMISRPHEVATLIEQAATAP